MAKTICLSLLLAMFIASLHCAVYEEPSVQVVREFTQEEPSVQIVSDFTEEEPSVQVKSDFTQEEPSVQVKSDFTQEESSIQEVNDFTQEEADISDIEKRSNELSNSALANALSGYNVVIGEPFNILEGVSVDPGMRHQIFVRDENVEVRKVTNCAIKSNAEIITTVSQFRQATQTSSVEGTSFGFEKKGEVAVEKGGASVSAEWEVSANAAFSESKSTKKVAEYLAESKGALAIASANCYIDQVLISSYALPGFTNKFKGALAALNEASSLTPTDRVQAFKRFIKTFGTHYSEDSILGARLMMTKYVTQKARQSMSSEALSKCTSNSLGMNLFGAKYSQNSEKCSSSDSDNLDNNSEFVDKTVLHSYGSTPATAVDDWAAKDFDPLPIKRVLKPINGLFADSVLRQHNLKNINGAKLREWFNMLYRNYCTTMGMSCGANAKGCGYTDRCKIYQGCIDLDKSKGTYKCVANCQMRNGMLKGVASKPIKVGTQSGEACVEACINEKKKVSSINGVMMLKDGSGGCWCQSYAYGVKDSSSSYKSCMLQGLPVDGHWSLWTSYGSCSKDCGASGVSTSSRSCASPAPKNNGKGCVGLSERSRPCNRFYCKSGIRPLWNTHTKGLFGIWGTTQYCRHSRFVYGFRLKSERHTSDDQDDTGLNAIELFCYGGGSITSTEGEFGEWRTAKYCTGNKPVIGFQMQIEKDQGDRDDTAANNVNLRCRGGEELKGNAWTSFGTWGSWLTCPAGMGVVGVETRVEDNQGSEDDTALNGIKLICADIISSANQYASAAAIEPLWNTQTKGFYGNWGSRQVCKNDQHVSGFRLKSEKNQGEGDDTALNAIELFCYKGGSISSKQGQWGDWTSSQYCGGNYPVIGFQMKIESEQGSGDDTAANDVNLKCKGGKELKGNAFTSWGKWGSWLMCPDGMAVAGLETRVEDNQGSSDDTALNGIKLICTSI